jgi:hypothetical protein
MDLNCPQCASDQTQKITAIVSSGTTHSVGRTNSMGVGSVGGKLAVGSSSGTTRSTSTSELAKKLAAPLKKSEALIVPFVLIMVFFGWIPIAMMGFFGYLVAGGLGYWLYTSLKKKSDAAKLHNNTVFQDEFLTWDKGFYCHRCEHSFVPSEV